MFSHVVIPASDSSQVGEARRVAARLAGQALLPENEKGRVAIIATELATNLLRHAQLGVLLVRQLDTAEGGGVELLALDKGPGMADVGKCLEDGYSTGGSSGTGLGAVRRISSEFDVYSSCPGGTVMVSRVRRGPPAPGPLAWGVVNVPAPGEQVSGDVYGVVQQSDAAVCLLADGLGHGQAAADAGVKARSVFASRAFDSPRQVLEAAHVEMRGTRGAAIAIARVDLVRGSLKFAGVGNISGTLLAAGASQGLCSHNGTLGVEARKFQEFDYPWAADTVLVLHSDGLQSRWKLQDYPGLVHRHPAVSAGILYRDYCRGRDDATVIVAKLRNGQERKSG